MKFFISPAVLVLVTILTLVDMAESLLTKKPDDVFVVRGSTVTLACYTNLSHPVMWQFNRVGDVIDWQSIYQGNPSVVAEKYFYKYKVTVDPTKNQYNLTINNLQAEEAGTYRCSDDYGLGWWKHEKGIPGHASTAEVVLVDSKPNCSYKNKYEEANMKHDKLDSGDTIRMTCSLGYIGNISPTLHWFVMTQERSKERVMFEPRGLGRIRTEGTKNYIISEVILEVVDGLNGTYIKCNVSNKEDGLDHESNQKLSEVTWRSSYLELSGSSPRLFATDTSSCMSQVIGTTVIAIVLVILVILIITTALVKVIFKKWICTDYGKFYSQLKEMKNNKKQNEEDIEVRKVLLQEENKIPLECLQVDAKLDNVTSRKQLEIKELLEFQEMILAQVSVQVSKLETGMQVSSADKTLTDANEPAMHKQSFANQIDSFLKIVMRKQVIADMNDQIDSLRKMLVRYQVIADLNNQVVSLQKMRSNTRLTLLTWFDEVMVDNLHSKLEEQSKRIQELEARLNKDDESCKFASDLQKMKNEFFHNKLKRFEKSVSIDRDRKTSDDGYQLRDVQAELKLKITELESTKKQLEDANKELHLVNAKLEEMNKKINQASKKLEEKDAQLAEKENTIREKEQKLIDQMREKKLCEEKYEKKLQEMRSDADSQKEMIAELNKTIRQQISYNKNLKKHLDSNKRDENPKRTHDAEAACYLGSGETLHMRHISHSNKAAEVTIADNQIFVARHKQEHVNVYDSVSLSLIRDIHIPRLNNPVGIAISQRALFVCDIQSAKFMHEVDLDTSFVSKWKMKGEFEPRSLTATTAHTLLVTAEIPKTDGASIILEYTSDGQLKRVIELADSITFIKHLVQWSEDQFIICHGSPASTKHRVCVIDKTGFILKCYGDIKGAGEFQLMIPEALAIDHNSGRVFVSDYGNNRVQVLQSSSDLSDLVKLGQVKTPIRFPSCICYDSSTDTLYIVEWETGHLVILTPMP